MRGFIFLVGTIGLLLCGCQSMEMTKHQSVPVSTNPMGAKVYVDGEYKGLSPIKLHLSCTEAHIITVVKDGYQQCDVNIKRIHCPEDALMRSASDGYRTGSFFKDASWGVQSGVASFMEAEATGQTYRLSPSAVSIKLAPANSNGSTVTNQKASAPNDGAAVSTVSDEESSSGSKLGTLVKEAGVIGSGFASKEKAGKDWTVSKSSHTKESFGPGSYSKTTTSSKTTVGVKVDTGAAIQEGASLLGTIIDKVENK